MTAPRRRALVLALALSLALLLAAPAGAAGADAGAPDPQPPALSPGGAGLRLDRSAEVAQLLPSTAPFWEEVRAAAQAAAQRSGLGLICRSAHLTVDGEVQVTQLLEVDALSGLGAALLVPRAMWRRWPRRRGRPCRCWRWTGRTAGPRCFRPSAWRR